MLPRQFIIALLLLVATTTGALAHAGLIAADPADGSVLAEAPAAIVLTFTEPVSPIGLSVVGVGGAPTPLTPRSAGGASVRVPLPAGLAKGSYLFSWRVTSEDGHPVNGTVGFAVGAPSGTIAATAATPLLATAIWLVRALQYVALLLGVGSAAFAALLQVPGLRRTSRALAGAGVLLVAPAMALQGLDLLGLPASALVTAAPWAEALASPYAATQTLLLVAFLLVLLPWRATALVAGLIGALAPALSGHASTAEPQWLMRGAVFVHLLSLTFWLGALIPLFVLLRTGDGGALRRFSRTIPWIMGALLLSGFVLAAVQLGPPGADWLSPYGILLAVKLSLVLALLLLALWNRVRLTSLAEAGDGTPLRRSIVVEVVLVCLILGIVAGWRFTPPPRVLAQIDAASAPITVSLTAPDATASLVVTPGRPGVARFEIGLPVAAESVTVQLQNPGEGIATISKPATGLPGDRWQVVGLVLPAGGDWSVAVGARTGKFDITTFRGTLTLTPTETSMTSRTLAAALASSMLLTAPAAAAGVLPSCPAGQSFMQGAITVTSAFTRATPKGAQSAGAYFSIANSGAAADTLTGASSTAASDVSLHQMTMNGNVMEMSALEGGLPIPAGGTALLGPMGNHLMLTGMSQPFAEGQCVQLTLHFAKAGDLPVELNVGGFGQQTPPAGDAMSSMDMDRMDMSSMSSMPGM